jgi:hypothetical protein
MKCSSGCNFLCGWLVEAGNGPMPIENRDGCIDYMDEQSGTVGRVDHGASRLPPTARVANDPVACCIRLGRGLLGHQHSSRGEVSILVKSSL